LAHDRLIEPVREDNFAWREAHLHPLQRQAALWEESGRPDGLLWREQALLDAESWAKAHEAELTSIDRDFLAACIEARTITEREQRQARRIRWLAVGATVFSILAIVAAVIAGFQMQSARRAAAAEAVAKSDAEIRLYEAQTAESRAEAAAVAEATANADAQVRLYDAQTAEAQAASAAKAEATANADAQARLYEAQTAEARAQELQVTQAVLLDVVLSLQESASDTPMATEPPATATPEGTPGVGPQAPTSATNTPAPDQTATAAVLMRQATVQAVQTELARVQATQTAVARTPIPTSLANSIRDYGATQGAKGWKYLMENGRNSGQFQEMRFGEYDGRQCWLTGGEEYVRICPGGEVHPGVTTRVAYEWKSAVDREVGIQVHAYKRDTNCGDGVKVEVFRVVEGTGRFDKLGEFGIGFADAVGITGTYNARVSPGTLVYVLVDIFGNAGCDESGIEIDIK
jgi:hypothetical protein